MEKANLIGLVIAVLIPVLGLIWAAGSSSHNPFDDE